MLDEKALKQFIAALPDLDNEAEYDGLGEEEVFYIRGVQDAYRVACREEIEGPGLYLMKMDAETPE